MYLCAATLWRALGCTGCSQHLPGKVCAGSSVHYHPGICELGFPVCTGSRIVSVVTKGLFSVQLSSAELYSAQSTAAIRNLYFSVL